MKTNKVWLAVVDVDDIKEDWYAMVDVFRTVVDEDSRSSRILSFSSFAYPAQTIYPPDLFRQVFDRDLGVCSLISAFGDVVWLNHLFCDMTTSAEYLQQRVDDVDATLELFSYGKSRGFDCDKAQIEATLRSGNWPTGDAPMLQTTSFLKQLANASAIAAQHPNSNVMWGVDNGLELSYPKVVAVFPKETYAELDSDWEPPCDASEILDLDARLKWSKNWEPLNTENDPCDDQAVQTKLEPHYSPASRSST